MKYEQVLFEDLGVSMQLSSFCPEGGVGEWHVMLHVEPRGDFFQTQYDRLIQAERRLLSRDDMQGARPVFKRYFLSDATNQQPQMQHGEMDSCTVSYIQQPPLDGSKVALWLYLQRGTEVETHADEMGSTLVRHNGYEHLWTMGMTVPEGSSYAQTRTLLEDYEQLLAQRDATMEGNCLRTWFFVRDVDTSYKGMVVARRENFEREGLSRSTHYIASTGIGGNPANTHAIIQFGSYAMKGFLPEQQQYLYALSHLNRTDEYGVTFERGTRMQYGDRSHLIISGTASIDHRGEVLHEGDVEKQTLRMWENVETLLAEGGGSFSDVMQIIVYLRDISDYEAVNRMFRERMPDIPTVFTLAPVCRPTWLIEMECYAVTPEGNKAFPDF
jgi:enamine deaminase RidA (YjgF/YER057c/UK114 family)